MLWFMRRPPIKRLRRNWIKWVPESRREKQWQQFRRQEAWARRYGVSIIKWTLTLFLAAILFQLVAAWVYYQQAAGAFDVSER